MADANIPAQPVSILSSLAFVDVETTGLSPTCDRIAEVGVVTVDDRQVERWTALLQTGSGVQRANERDDDGTVRFSAISADLERRLAGRPLVAHNARFDVAFLRAEFARVGTVFAPRAICSVMLSRKLYPELIRHDLDSLALHHGLRIDARHRALPDADALWQLWQILLRERPARNLRDAVAQLLAAPVLPAHLDPALVDRLPECPGVYVFHGEENAPLFAGAASNLKRRVIAYFRNDRASRRALEYSHRITNITWRATGGVIGARLHACATEQVLFDSCARSVHAAPLTWEWRPERVPCIAIVPLLDRGVPRLTECFGVFASERKACNALSRIATRHRLCRELLGTPAAGECAACGTPVQPCACGSAVERARQLVRLFALLRPMRVPSWPHHGPIGIREHADLHIVHDWQFLGTARTSSDVYQSIDVRRHDFDWRTYRLLRRTLPRLPAHRVVDLAPYHRLDCSAGVPRRWPAD
jgi:DNA polymerase III subunit epsilon